MASIKVGPMEVVAMGEAVRAPFNDGPGNTKQIEMFLHCARCVGEGRGSDIEVGWTVFGMQVWCRRHDINMMHVDFMGSQHPADMTARAGGR